MTTSEPFDLTAFDPAGGAAPHDDPPVRVQSRSEFHASIPYLLGFRPERSLVAIGLDRDGRVLVTARVDAPTDVESARSAVEQMQAVLHRSAPKRLLVAYCDDYEVSADEPAELQERRRSAIRFFETVRDLEPVLRREFRSWGLPVAFVWPENPGEPRGQEGPLPQIAVAQAVSGRRLLRSRAEVAAQLEPVAGSARRATKALVGELAGVPHSRVDLVAQVTDILERYAGAAESGRVAGAIEPHEAAVCVLAARDVATRDILITIIAQEPSWRHEELWCRVTQLAPTAHTAPVATIAGICAYLGGDGALAGCAFDVARQHDPDYSLAMLIDSSLRAGVPPQQLREILASTFDPAPSRAEVN